MTEQERHALLPCPFTGEIPMIVHTSYTDNNMETKRCCSIRSSVCEVVDVSEQAAMNQWNSRATPQVTDAKRQAALDDLDYHGITSSDYLEKHESTIRAALSSPPSVCQLGEDCDLTIAYMAGKASRAPAVPVIEGLDSIIQDGRTWYGVAGSIDPVAVPIKDFDVLMRCARAYAALQKGA